MSMSDQDKYTKNLVVKPRRKPVEVNPETEEAFEESKELTKESLRQAAKTNMAFVAWLGIFCWRLLEHGFLFCWAKVARNNAETSGSAPRKPSPGQGHRNRVDPKTSRKDQSARR
jgi:hypothetical protein